MTDLVRPADDAHAAQWLLQPGVDWWDLVRYGPPGFDVYLRVALAPAEDEADTEGEAPALRLALATLAGHSWSSSGFAAVWDGWGGRGPAPRAPRLDIPHRPMLLFTGPVGLLRDAPALAWSGSAQGYQEPHLVWPEDRSWCVACEVDEEIEFTVGCSFRASRALVDALPGAVREVAYGDPAPLYRNGPA